MVYTLEEAIQERLDEREQRETARSEGIAKRSATRRQLAELTKSEVQDSFRTWLEDRTDIVLPDEVWIFVMPKGVVDGRQRFDISVHFTGEEGAPGKPYVMYDSMFEYHHGVLLPLFASNWRANPQRKLPQSFGDFLDAVIYALGGAERLANRAPLPFESEAVHVF